MVVRLGKYFKNHVITYYLGLKCYEEPVLIKSWICSIEQVCNLYNAQASIHSVCMYVYACFFSPSERLDQIFYVTPAVTQIKILASQTKK